MTPQQGFEKIFNVTHLSHEEVFDIIEARKSRERVKAYHLTNNDERYELLKSVITKETTMKEVAYVHANHR